MSQDNATVNLYVNDKEAISSFQTLTVALKDLTKAKREAYKAGDLEKALEIESQLTEVRRKRNVVAKQELDVEKALSNIGKISTNQLIAVKKQLSAEIKTLNRDTEEYITKRQKLIRIEDELKSATSRTNDEQKKGISFLKKITPTIDLASIFFKAIDMAKQFVAEVWNVSKELQAGAKKASTVFGDELGYVEYQATKASKAMGVTNAEFVSMSANTADLLIPLAFSRKEAAKMAVDLQSLTGALNEWSLGKYGAEEVSARLTKAVLGETESLKELGISIRMDSDEYEDLVAEKMKDSNTSEMQARALATLELIYAKTTDAQAAYASSGNELLRFQNSASRGWRGMIESIGEWFAFSDLERAEKAHRIYGELNKEYERTEGVLDTLMPRYEELQSKVNKNSSEQEELNSIVSQVAAIYSGAVTEVDAYGNAIAISASKVEVAREAQRLLRKEMLEDVNFDLQRGISSKNLEISSIRQDASRARLSDLWTDDAIVESNRNERIAKADAEVAVLQQEIGKAALILRENGKEIKEIAEESGKEVKGVFDLTPDEIEDYIKAYEDAAKAKRKAEAGGGKSVAQDYKLNDDAKYNQQRQELKQKLADGLIKSEEAYQRQQLQLEASFLEKEIKSGKYSSDQIAALQEQLNDRRIALAKSSNRKKEDTLDKDHEKALKAEEKRQKELASIADRRGSDVDIARRKHVDKLTELGLFGKLEKDMTEAEKAALLQLELEYGKELSSLQLATANKTLINYRSEVDQKLQAMKIAQGEEFSQAQTLEELKLIMSRGYSAEEIAEATSVAQAKKMVLAQYDEETKTETERLLTELLATYQGAITELSESGSLFGDAVSLTDEDSAKLKEIINKLKAELAALKLVAEGEGEKKDPEKRADVLGMSAENWDELFSNLDDAKNKTELLAGAAQAIGSAWGSVNSLIDACAQRELANYEEVQDDKKAALDRQLDQGIISQEAYNRKVSAIDEETAAKREELEKEQAEREKALAIFNAIINTAVGITKALELGPIAGPILAGVIGAMGAVQVAAIAAQPLPGAEDGGYINVVRSQDGKPYNAEYSPKSRGYVNKPTVLVGENGSEFVASHRAVSNPTIRPVLDIIDRAQRNGSVGSLNLAKDIIYPTRYVMPGREDGGAFTPQNPTNHPTNSYGGESDAELRREIKLLIAQLKEPVQAYVVMTGRNGLKTKLDEISNQINKSKV